MYKRQIQKYRTVEAENGLDIEVNNIAVDYGKEKLLKSKDIQPYEKQIIDDSGKITIIAGITNKGEPNKAGWYIYCKMCIRDRFKGYFNDPALVVEGFNTYGIVHETYALTRVIYFVMTGKTNTEKIANQNLRAFVERGLNPDKSKRFQNIRDMVSAFKTIYVNFLDN